MTRIPGLRFHPTDDELINYYLKRKVLGKRIRFEVISEIEIYKCAPWDLPGMSCLRTKDREWYFFCPMARKYSNGDRMNRATEYGYWKSTGKDRTVLHRDQTVGLIKTLIFHTGKAPKGERTDWVMHEYRLADKDLAADIVQDSYVICKVFQKSGPGPKNGAQYGAPYIEEESSDDEEVAGIESFSLAGLLAPAPALQVHQQNSAMTSTYISGTMCIGSSSESTHNMLIPGQDNNFSLAQNHQQSSSMTSRFVAGTKSIGSSSGSTLSNIRLTDYMRRPVQDNNVSPAPNHQQISAVTSTFVSGTMSAGSSSESALSNMGSTNNILRPVQQYIASPALHNHQQSSAMTSTFVSGTMSTGSSSGSTFSNMRGTDYMLRPVQDNNVLPTPNHQQSSAVISTFVSGTMSIGSSSGSALSNVEPTNNMRRPVREYNGSPALQNHQQSSAMTSTFISGTMSTGLSSGATLSSMRPTDNMLRPVQYNTVSMPELTLPVDDDAVNMLDWFSDVIIPVLNEDNQNEILDNVIGSEGNIEAALDDDFYNCLAVPSWDDMYINSSSFPSLATDSLNDASYLELNDLQSPLVPHRKI